MAAVGIVVVMAVTMVVTVTVIVMTAIAVAATVVTATGTARGVATAFPAGRMNLGYTTESVLPGHLPGYRSEEQQRRDRSGNQTLFI